MTNRREQSEVTTTAAEAPRRELAQLEMNPFESYGSQVAQKSIVGRLLKFTKGDWLAGEDDEEIEEGTKFVVNMDQLLVGWVKWVGNKPEQQLMGLLVEGHQAPKRDSLGDTDHSSWEVGTDGKERDPWQFTNYLLLKTPGSDGSDDANLFTFATSSRGGLTCVGELCKTYGKEMRARADQYPVIEIGTDSYKHPNPEFGRIKVPTMKVVGWEPKSQFGQRQEAA